MTDRLHDLLVRGYSVNFRRAGRRFVAEAEAAGKTTAAVSDTIERAVEELADMMKKEKT